MKATITYCYPCRYQTEALVAADTLLALGVDSVELVKGDNGIFDIAIDGSMSYSKPIGAPFPGYTVLAAIFTDAKARSDA